MSNLPIHAIILAAGQSKRMGHENKLLKEWNSKPLILHVLEAAMSSDLENLLVVLGHEAELIEQVLPKNVSKCENVDFSSGMASSIVAGLNFFPSNAPVLIMLADMPLITDEHINALSRAFKKQNQNNCIVVATHQGEWGNPVLFGVDYYEQLKKLKGDVGARALIKANSQQVISVEIGEAAIRDFDRKDAF